MDLCDGQHWQLEHRVVSAEEWISAWFERKPVVAFSCSGRCCPEHWPTCWSSGETEEETQSELMDMCGVSHVCLKVHFSSDWVRTIPRTV